MSLFNLIVRPGDDSVRRDKLLMLHPNCVRMWNPQSICSNLNYLFRKGAEIKVGAWAATQQRLLLKFGLHVDTEQADKACLISYLFGSKAANLWGHPVISPKLLEGWGLRARYHCRALSTLSKHAICWDKMEPGSAGSQARKKLGMIYAENKCKSWPYFIMTTESCAKFHTGYAELLHFPICHQ